MIQPLIEGLQRRCPSCTFSVEDAGATIRIVEYGRRFVVRLEELGITAEEWFQYEIDQRPLDKVPSLEPDEKYRIVCPVCGPVAIGYGNYFDQMNKPDKGWYCPTCGSDALFDDRNYEAHLENKEE